LSIRPTVLFQARDEIDYYDLAAIENIPIRLQVTGALAFLPFDLSRVSNHHQAQRIIGILDNIAYIKQS
jgi:hypothetical protein